MKKIVLISCSDKKLPYKAPAKDLYQGEFFKKSLQYSKKIIKADKVFILSAKHNLLPLNQEIEPYDVTLSYLSPEQREKKPNTKVLTRKERKDWAIKVLNQLKEVSNLDNDEIIFLAGERYREYLTPHITHYSIPTKGLGQYKQVQYLKEALSNER